MRGRSYSPASPRGYGRRRSPSPRGRYGGRSRDLPTSLLVRNLRHDCRPDDIRRPFERFGPLKDIYLPRDYYSGDPRGFGFVQFVDPEDATEAKYQMDGQFLLGRELTVVFAEENRKKPTDMRARERGRRYRSGDRRRSSYSRSRSRSYERGGYYSPRSSSRYSRRRYSRSVSQEHRRYGRDRSRSQQSRERNYSYSPSPKRSFSRSPPPDDDTRSFSNSPVPHNGDCNSPSNSQKSNSSRSTSSSNES